MTTLPEPLETLSTPLAVDQLSEEMTERSIDVGADDRAALAKRLDLPAVNALSGTLKAVRHGTLIHIDGRIDAELERTCVVSLEPMSETVGEDFSTDYTTDLAEGMDDDIEGDLDAPELLEGETLDLGDVLLEQLVLAMTPHPRKEGAEAPNDPGAGKESSPFDVLKALKS
ncbi:MAG: DUF177 domain-containing protein [Pseudomonadota bacterium]